MESRFSKPRSAFKRLKDRFGEKMEKYPVKNSADSQTDFQELEQYRDKSRKETSIYSKWYRIFTTIGILIFIYFLIRLTGEDLINVFY